MSISSPFSVGKFFEHRCVQMVAVFFKKKVIVSLIDRRDASPPFFNLFQTHKIFKLPAGIKGMHLS